MHIMRLGSRKNGVTALVCMLTLLCSAAPAEAFSIKKAFKKTVVIGKGIILMPVAMAVGATVAIGGTLFGIAWRLDEIDQEG